jgi:hypothetical protein
MANTTTTVSASPPPLPGRGNGGRAYPIGAYYFPSWGVPGVSQWGLVPVERLPVRGAYDERDPAVVNSQLQEMITFGLDYVNLCWYWNAGLRQPHAGTWADNYRSNTVANKPRVTLMWDNTFSTIDTVVDWDAMVDHWLNVYSERADYFRIGDRPVVTVYSPALLKAQAGGGTDAGVKFLLDRARARVRGRGLGISPAANFFFLACGTGPHMVGGAGNAEAMGFDGVTAYNLVAGTNWDTYSATFSNFSRQGVTTSPLPVLLPLGAGWDDIGGSTITNPTINQFTAGLRLGLQYADYNPQNVLGFVVGAWNEFKEGSVIEPAAFYGGTARGLAIKSVFKP